MCMWLETTLKTAQASDRWEEVVRRGKEGTLEEAETKK